MDTKPVISTVPSTTAANPGTNASTSSSQAGTPQPQAQVVNLYTDFASDSVPTEVKAEVQGTNVNPEVNAEAGAKPRKPNPREEWLDKENPLHCKLCDFTAKDMQIFQNHSLSIKHIKRAADVFDIKFNLKKDDEENKEKKKPEFHCQVCLCSCNSESAWNSHLVGQKHRKNLEKQGADKALMKAKQKMHQGIYGMGAVGRGGGPVHNTQFPHNRKPYDRPMHTGMNPNQSGSGPIGALAFANYKEPLIGLEYVTEIQVTGQSPRYHCELCDAKFDHNLKFPHLVGAKHRFNVLKEKRPEVAQAIRVGINKRSELTGKLLDEAARLEQQEGRKQVKTRVEASPYASVNNPQMNQHQSTFAPGRGGRGTYGRGNAPNRGNRGQPLRGGAGGFKPPGRGYTPNNTNYNSGFNAQNYSSNQNFGNTTQQRGRGRGARGQVQSNRGRGRGWRGQQHQGQQSFYQAPNQPYPSYSANNTYSGTSQSASLLPKEAFLPQRPQENYSQSHNQPYNYSNQGTGQIGQVYDHAYSTNPQQSSWQGSQGATSTATPTPAPPASTTPAAPSASESVAQGLLKGLGELGKLVSSEEDASVALQVSNALTQALLQYRMQNMPNEEKEGKS